MKVKLGQWIRTKYREIHFISDLKEYYGVENYNLFYEDLSGYTVRVADDPRLLIETGDLVEYKGKVIEVFIGYGDYVLSNETVTSILRNYIKKIWTKNDLGDYEMQWEEKSDMKGE